MPKRIQLRTLTEEEEEEIRRLAKSRSASMRMVQRAKIIVAMLDSPDLPASHAGQKAGLKSDVSGIQWVRRFNEEGIGGLEDRPRSGKPVTHTEQVRSQLIDLALQKPQSIGYPFELWTLTRIQIAYKEQYGMHLSRSTIWEWFKDEGLAWKRQQSWFQNAERHDPDFVEKRGP